jgi:hypothetical protein
MRELSNARRAGGADTPSAKSLAYDTPRSGLVHEPCNERGFSSFQ